MSHMMECNPDGQLSQSPVCGRTRDLTSDSELSEHLRYPQGTYCLLWCVGMCLPAWTNEPISYSDF